MAEPHVITRGIKAPAAVHSTCPPYHNAQAYIRPHHHLHTHTYNLERTLQLRHSFGVYRIREAIDTGYKPSLNWRRVRRQELLLMVGEIFESHWIATVHLKLGSPQPLDFYSVRAQIVQKEVKFQTVASILLAHHVMEFIDMIRDPPKQAYNELCGALRSRLGKSTEENLRSIPAAQLIRHW
ncbi:hypothetical protein Pcinc_007367 [Petrolisthes cinctipes]|uniref:Uncharacterized protein n=1 Tax=Petrolisthes cinctipes TaxID=88211 RepID=A0AAE1G9J4_PETCI|nr:hypothetical protein Pcinc_007367 [Petrolisthes cinctipes]